jgi:hypothetical protein
VRNYYLYMDIQIAREHSGYVHTVTIEYDPFPALAPTFATVACIADIVIHYHRL